MKTRLTLSLSLFLLPSVVLSGGFQLFEHSASGLGRAFSGEAVIADDASVIASNPAAMGLIRKEKFSGNLSLARVLTDTFIEQATLDAEIDLLVQLTSSTTVSGSNSEGSSSFTPIPALYYVKPYSRKINWGIGVFSNFGLSSDSGDDFSGRFTSDSTKILTLTMNPSISYRWNKKLWLGAGISLTYGDSEFGQAIPDVLALGGSTLGTALGTLLGVDLSGLLAGDIDGGQAKITGDGFQVSGNVGLLYRFSKRTRVGLSYRPGMTLSLKGSASFENCSDGNVAVLAALSEICGDGFSTEIPLDLPSIFKASIYHRYNRRWAFHADMTYTRWSRFESVQILNTSDNNSVFFEVNQGFQDSYRYAIGATYWHSRKYKLRMGVAKDETPVDESQRTLNAADSNRTILSLGGQYRKNKRLSFDIAYARYIFDNFSFDGSSSLQKIDLGVGSIDVTSTTKGNGAIGADLFSVQVNWNF